MNKILPAEEMQKKHRLYAGNRPKIKLDKHKVPKDLHKLIPLAEKWGIGDDIIRADFEEKTSVEMQPSNSKIEVSQMSEAQKQRWNHCRNILKLPYEVSAQLTFNDSERNLSGWIVPDEDVVPTRLISLNGLVKSGKSLIAAFLSIKEDLPVFSLDKFSVYTVDAYLEELKANGISKDSNAAEFIKVISEFINRNPKRKMDNRSAKSLRETLNELTNFFEKGYRPKVMLIDGVGDKPEGVIPLNAYHLASLYGSEASILIEIPELANNLDLFEYGRLDVRQEVPPYFVFYRIRHPGVGRYTGDIDTRILPDSLDVLLTEFRNKIKEKSDF